MSDGIHKNPKIKVGLYECYLGARNRTKPKIEVPIIRDGLLSSTTTPPDEKAHKNQLLISLREIAHWCKFQWPSSMRRHNGHNCILQEVYFKKLLFLYGQIYRWDRHGPKGYRGTYIMILLCVSLPCSMNQGVPIHT